MEPSSHSGKDNGFIFEAVRADAKVEDDLSQTIACLSESILRLTRCGNYILHICG